MVEKFKHQLLQYNCYKLPINLHYTFKKFVKTEYIITYKKNKHFVLRSYNKRCQLLITIQMQVVHF